MMREELDYRRIQLRPQLLEAVKEARAFGDLSENFEYKAAKQGRQAGEKPERGPHPLPGEYDPHRQGAAGRAGDRWGRTL